MLSLAVWQDTCQTYKNLVYDLAHHVSPIAQWLKRPTGNWKVMGSTPVGGSENSFSEYFDLRALLRYLRRNSLLYAGWLLNLRRFQEARPDHVRVESSSCCFPRELMSFVRSKELVSFDPRQVTRFPPIRKLTYLIQLF